MARKKLTPERIERIRVALVNGARIEVAASHGGIHPSTYFDWVAKGQAALDAADGDADAVPQAERGYADFSDITTQARDQWELAAIARIQQAAVGQPYQKTKRREWQQVVEGKVITLHDETVETGTTFDWRADFELLRARLPKHYGRLTRTELSGPEGAPIEVRSVEDLFAQATADVDELAARRLKTGTEG